MTDAMKRAFKWLEDRGGSGVIDRHGRVVAGGEHSTQDASTWLRLVAAGQLVGRRNRIFVRPDIVVRKVG